MLSFSSSQIYLSPGIRAVNNCLSTNQLISYFSKWNQFCMCNRGQARMWNFCLLTVHVILCCVNKPHRECKGILKSIPESVHIKHNPASYQIGVSLYCEQQVVWAGSAAGKGSENEKAVHLQFPGTHLVSQLRREAFYGTKPSEDVVTKEISRVSQVKS